MGLGLLSYPYPLGVDCLRNPWRVFWVDFSSGFDLALEVLVVLVFLVLVAIRLVVWVSWLGESLVGPCVLERFCNSTELAPKCKVGFSLVCLLTRDAVELTP